MSNKTTTQYMPSNGLFHRVGQIVPWGGTNSPIGWDKVSHGVGQLRTLILSLLMLVLGSGMAWGQTEITSLSQITATDGNYVITQDISGGEAGVSTFSGTLTAQAKNDGTFPVISDISKPLFATATDATISNLTFKSISVSGSDNVGAICGTADGSTRIYNCGILPTTTNRDEDGNVTGFSGSSVSGTGNVGGLVGILSGNARVINCYSYANISGGTNAAGIVGNNAVATTQSNLKTMVMNCMFYGNITGASTMKPVYGGTVISNAGASGVNNYNYYRNGEDVTFDGNYDDFDAYYCTLPADEEYLTRFEYYRSILNSNKKLCTWWINGTSETAPTDANVEAIGIAKWVLDPEIAPYPILKKWGKYPSVINQDPEYVWNPKTQQKVSRTSAEPYQGKRLGTISVTVNAGAKYAGTGNTSVTLPSVIVMDMDTLNHDYGYAKIQLPYYNEVFGDPTANADTQWDKRYAGNYKDYVVTGWKITNVSGGTPGSFKGYAVTSVPAATSNVSAGTVTPDDTSGNPWEDGFNFADRNCTNKDKYSKSGRVFAQGGYYYVPEGVTAITIEAYWGKAVYLHNKDHSLDRVNVAAKESKDGSGGADNTDPDFGSAFTPAGTLATTFQTYAVKTNLQDAIAALTNNASYTVYDQAIVLVGNVQVKNRGGSLSNGSRAFTIMSCDLDMDNEPDYCLQFQQRNKVNRPLINPVRFDFLPVPELGLAIRTNIFAYTIGLMVPKGHFEITETSFMHTTQFEYDYDFSDRSEAPLILNGGHFEQIVVRKGPKNRTSYILMGGHFRMKRFTPGWHATPQDDKPIRHCAVNAIGGEYPEFYLSGIYAPSKTTSEDDPHCYTNGGYFGLMAGAGYEQVRGDVTFKIDHSIIREFYGGGINAAKPVTGKIDVTINNSLVGKYCGGPKVGVMSTVDGKLKTVTTNATGTTFGVFYGGGNGGTSYYREKLYDNTRAFPTTDDGWKTASGNYTPKFNEFNPLNQENINAAYKNDWGYHAEYEFEVFNASNGLNTSDDVIRLYYHWAQFGTTTTGDVTSTLTNCTVTGNFFGGGNLANVTGNVTSTLKGNTHIYGSAYAAGFSASIPSFPVHNKSTVRFPKKDKAGNVAEQGSLDYYQDGGKNRMYTWCYKNASGKVFPEGVVIPEDASTSTKLKSVFKYPNTDDGKWYVLTNVSLEGLGAVSGNAKITLDEGCVIDGSVYGGGEESAVGGNTEVTVEGGTVTGNVYGGGNLGSVGTYTVDGNNYTFTENTGECTVNITGGMVGPDTPDPTKGNVFGAGKGIANTFQCEKGMVYKANVSVSGGTVNGTVYGGGEIGRVEDDTEVKIGDGNGGAETPTPNIHGNVFGAGKGLNTHGYSALVRGNSKVTVEGDAKVDGSIYGGGEISSVGRYTLVSESNQSQYPGLEIGMPGSLANSGSGKCTVIVRGHAEIGPDGMQMTASGGPDDRGHIFGAGEGATPQVYTYNEEDKTTMPKRMMSYNSNLYKDVYGPNEERIIWEYADAEHQNVWEYFDTEAKYLTFIETMALTTQTEVTVDGSAFVKGSVYGGSENGFVQHNTKVMIKGGQIGAGAGESSPYADNKFINPATTTITSANTLKACATWDYEADGKPYDKFAGSTGYDAKGGAVTATDGHTFYGNVFGGGSGLYPYAPGKWHRKAGSVGGDTRIEISGGHILSNVYGGNEQTDVGTYTHDANDAPIIADGGTCTIVMTGGTIGVPRTATAIEALPTIGHLYGAGKGDKRILFNTWTNVGATSVSVSGGIVYGNVYGGGEDGHVMGNAVTTISETDATNKPTVIGSVGNAGFDGNVFGGGQGSPTALTAGVVGGNANLNVQGGHMLGSVYGGGRIASVGTFFAMATDPRYGKMQDGDDHGYLAVNLTGGTIEQNVYGGCMGTNAAADADAEAIAFAAKLGMSKTVEVNLNKDVANDARGCAVKGDIFGCNNTNASPQQAVTVHVYATQNAGKTQIANTSGETPVTDAKRKGVYDVRAVYGGGNLAAYKPITLPAPDVDDNGKDTKFSTNVIIDGCGRTSIQTVYGGGNAASTPATSLTVNGTYEIEEVFGGGNGKDKITINGVLKDNPGANVGFYDYSAVEETYPTKEDRQDDAFTSKYVYGSGKASVNIFGGTVHRVFGGSNTKGNVRQTAVTMLDENSGCDFCVDEAYGGGKEAPMDAEAKLHMACIPGLSAAYGGAEAADIQGNVTLNITNGTFDRVFGGNNLSGTISGSLTVNIEEIGCKPIIIGELYGGGNQAGYSVKGYDSNKQPKETGDDLYAHPQVNVKSFTSIGDIYGGGYGETAVMVGNPTVNVSVAEGDWKDYVGDPDNYNDEGYIYNATGYKGETLTITDDNGTHDVVVPSHAKGKIGAINNVFGGGNAAKVIGNTNVNIGTLSTVTVRSYVEKDVTVGASVAGLYTRSGAGTVADPYKYIEKGPSDVAEENVTYYEEKEVDKDVLGADIRGNVYGGGNNAEVTGNTNVVIGKKNE